MACSFIPKASLRKTAMPCWAISWPSRATSPKCPPRHESHQRLGGFSRRPGHGARRQPWTRPIPARLFDTIIHRPAQRRRTHRLSLRHRRPQARPWPRLWAPSRAMRAAHARHPAPAGRHRSVRHRRRRPWHLEYLHRRVLCGGGRRRAGGQAWQPFRHLQQRRRRYAGSAGREDRPGTGRAPQRCWPKTGIVFLFAQTHHPAMHHVGNARKQIKRRTIFNLLGPLASPARVKHQLVGVFSADWLVPYAEALKALGSDRALVVHGARRAGRSHHHGRAPHFASLENGHGHHRRRSRRKMPALTRRQPCRHQGRRRRPQCRRAEAAVGRRKRRLPRHRAAECRRRR